MEYTSSQIVYSRQYLNRIASAMIAGPGAVFWDTPKLYLNINPSFVPGPGFTADQIVANNATFSGYPPAGLPLTVSGPVNVNPSTQAVLGSSTFTATAADPFVPNEVYGYWITDKTGLILMEQFPPGVSASIATPGDFVTLVILGALPANVSTGLI
jgi:hypothetical protein